MDTNGKTPTINRKRIHNCPVVTAMTLHKNTVFGIKTNAMSMRSQGRAAVGTVKPSKNAFLMRELMVTMPSMARETGIRPETELLIDEENNNSSSRTCIRPIDVTRRIKRCKNRTVPTPFSNPLQNTTSRATLRKRCPTSLW